MGVRNAADYRTLFWAFVLFPLVPAFDYASPRLAPWLFPASLYLSYCAGIFTHNHNHRAVFTNRIPNQLYAAYLSLFYGLPIFTWIPTHNRNHHRFLDGEGDVTQTSKLGRENTLVTALFYPFASAHWQAACIRAYVTEARQRHPHRFRAICLQYAVVGVGHLSLASAAVLLHGWVTGLSTYFVALGAPALFASYSMMFTNYIQHVHCDPTSANNHSRNFVAPLTNWFVFDAGFHTVHHENPGAHWSQYRALHAQRKRDIHPSLNEHSVLTFCVKSYVLGAFSPRFRTKRLVGATPGL